MIISGCTLEILGKYNVFTKLFKSPEISNACRVLRQPYHFHEELECSNLRSYSTAKGGIHGSSVPKVKELEIPVPYGKLLAKAWGSETAYPVLAFHGWLDNCGTFDKLIPLLSDQFYFVAIDAPGHGRSSHRPPGSVYTDPNMIIDFKRVSDYLGWNKFHLLGHSLGGALALRFSSIFPDLVNKVVTLDIAKPVSVPADLVPNFKIRAIEEFMRIEEKMLKPAPVYTSETAPARLRKGMHDEINEEGAEILLQRGAKVSDCGKGLVFTRDLRCKPMELISIESHEVMKHFMSELQCELLIILANNPHPDYQPDTPEIIESFLDLYRKKLQNFVLEHVEGNHFVHLNNPERIAPIINKFLLNQSSKI